jgi:hypothetical protein
MAEKRLPQIGCETTPKVKQKLAALEKQLKAQKVVQHEIVGVLIQEATAKSITADALARYREDRARAVDQLGKSK